MSSVLAIFAKAPLVGQVKTRLCPPLSFEEATELYRCFLLDTVELACSLAEVQVCVTFAPADSEPLFRKLLPFPLLYFPQRGTSLGEREANVFSDLLAQKFSRVVIIGSDIPTLPPAHLENAFALLADRRNDVVIGPSTDGGYYLLGARRLHPTLFENITWSTAAVCTETLVQAQRAGLQVAQIPSWYDVDEKDDLQKLIVELGPRKNAARAPRTRAMLERLGFFS